jgi:hypothetical protein
VNRCLLTVLIAAAAFIGQVDWVLAHSQVSSARLDFETRIELREKTVSVECALTINRPGAFLEVLKIDTNQDGDLSQEEQARYFERIGKHITTGIEVKLNGVPAVLEPAGDVELAMPFKKLYRFNTKQPVDWQSGATLEFHNDCFLEYQGSVTTIVDPCNVADIIYNSQWEHPTAPGADAQERDVVVRYRAGTGLEQPDGSDGAFDTAEIPQGPVAGISLGRSRRRQILSATLLAIGVCSVLVLARLRRMRIAALVLPLCLVAVGLLIWPTGRSAVLDDAEAVDIFRELHRNIYTAFEGTIELEVYDVLADSLDGELLDEIYNEVYVAVLSGNDATTFDIRRVKPLSSTLLPGRAAESAGAYCVRHNWRVYGTVSHFGHRHSRINEYRAVYTVAARTGQWRITDVRIEQQQRVDPVSSL